MQHQSLFFRETKRKTEVAVAMKDGERVFGSAAVAQVSGTLGSLHRHK